MNNKFKDKRINDNDMIKVVGGKKGGTQWDMYCKCDAPTWSNENPGICANCGGALMFAMPYRPPVSPNEDPNNGECTQCGQFSKRGELCHHCGLVVIQ